jgi:hypothetical protein
MEHFLIALFAELSGWINRRSRRPLHRVIPNLDPLRADPRGVLMEGPITIPPYVPRGTVFVWVLLLTLVISCTGILSLIDLNPRGVAAQHREVIALVTLLLVFVVIPIGLWQLLSRMLRGGVMILDSDGVRLLYRRVEVYCPWTLFSLPSNLRKEEGKPVVVGVAPSAVPGVIAYQHGHIIATGEEVSTRPLKFVSFFEVELRNLYKAPIEECTELLFHLGKRMATSERV